MTKYEVHIETEPEVHEGCWVLEVMFWCHDCGKQYAFPELFDKEAVNAKNLGFVFEAATVAAKRCLHEPGCEGVLQPCERKA